MPDKYRFHGDPPKESEFSWGRGLTPPGLGGAPPNQGGRYQGKSPDATEPAELGALKREP